jgi:hypothetical protein
MNAYLYIANSKTDKAVISCSIVSGARISSDDFSKVMYVTFESQKQIQAKFFASVRYFKEKPSDDNTT